MNFLDKKGLITFLGQLNNIFGNKATLDKCAEARNAYLLNIDYDAELKFNTDLLVINNAPYIGSAVVGSTCVA